jgi:hypothetical protein
MKAGLSLEALLTEVVRQKNTRRDFVTSTKDAVRLALTPGFNDGLSLLLLKEGAQELERFAISATAHDQIAAKLGIPSKYYDRLLKDHTDMVVGQVNTLFEREPSARLVRVLDGKVRAFLSDRFLRLDNNEVLEQTLPLIVKGDIATRLISSNVTDNHLYLKVLFTDDKLKQEISTTRGGELRVVRPGFRLSNSETGFGALKINAFFWDSYCENGCVFGMQDFLESVSFNRSHLGGRLLEGVNYQVISDETRVLQDQAIISSTKDVMKAIASVEFAAELGKQLRAAANSERVKSAIGAVDLAVKELDLRQGEKESILETFIKDGDYSKWGLASAVTAVANLNDEAVSYERASELENIGAKILSLDLKNWKRFVEAEPIARAA